MNIKLAHNKRHQENAKYKWQDNNFVMIIDHVKTSVKAVLEMHLLGKEINFHFQQKKQR